MDTSQRIATVLGLILAAIVLCSGALFIGYIYGQNNGYSVGYEAAQIIAAAQDNNQYKQESYQAGYKAGRESGPKGANTYNLHNPTYQEMVDFLAQDTTDSKAYIADKYICTDYAADVKNNAVGKGIRCAIVYILNRESIGHTIVAFETTDRGLQFVEPQFDKVVRLVVGQGYSKLNNFLPQPTDDTIQRYLVIW